MTRTHVPDAPGYRGNDPNKWYLAYCQNCQTLQPFSLAKDRAAWWTAHQQATGHTLTCIDQARTTP